MKVFIIGIAGRTGSRLALSLARQGIGVGGLARETSQITSLAEKGIQATLGDIGLIDVSTLSTFFEGVDVAVFTAGAAESEPDAAMDAVDGSGVTKMIAAARLAGLRRLYLVSAFPEALRGGPLDASFERYIAIKKRSEVELAASELDWVVLRASVLLDAAATGEVALAAAQYHTEITRDDVATTLAALIRTPAINRVILEVTGGTTPIDDAVAWVATQ